MDAETTTGDIPPGARETPWTHLMDNSDGNAVIEVAIANKYGLHARPVMRFVDLACKFESAIQVCRGDKQVDGKSPMELMLLEATEGTILKICARGSDAQHAVEALAELIRTKFGEE